MIDLTLWCMLCGKDAANGPATKNLTKSLQRTIRGFTKVEYYRKGGPTKICKNCDKFIRLYEKHMENCRKAQEMFVFALRKNRLPEELVDLRKKFNINEELRDWKSAGFSDVMIKVEKVDNSLYESFTVDSFDDQIPETELVVKAEPMSPRPATPDEIIPFLPQYSPHSDPPDKFDNSPPPSPGSSDSGGLSDPFEFRISGQTLQEKMRICERLEQFPDKVYECDFCGFKSCWKRSVGVHIRKVHLKLPPPMHKCPKCPRTYQKKHYLKLHKEAEHGKVKKPRLSNDRFKCHYCGKKMQCKNALLQHVATVHENRRDFQCSICSKMLSSKSGLQLHEETHKETKNYQCKMCPKRFKSANNLRIHSRRHSNVPCCCDICGAELVSARQLKFHKEFVHDGKTAQTCIACGKRFNRPAAYKMHLISIHTDLRPYVCPYCKRTFNDGSNFAKHKRETHPVEFAEEKKCIEPKGTKLPSMKDLLARIQADLQ